MLIRGIRSFYLKFMLELVTSNERHITLKHPLLDMTIANNGTASFKTNGCRDQPSNVHQLGKYLSGNLTSLT